MIEELILTRRLWKGFHDIAKPDIFQVMLYSKNPEKSSLTTIAFNNAKVKYENCLTELVSTLNELQKVAPHLEVIQQFSNGKLLENNYQAIFDNIPVTFGLINDFKYKKKYVAVEINFKLYNIRTEIYTFLLHIKSKRKDTWNYQTEIKYLQGKELINSEYDYFRIGDLFKNKTDKEIQKVIISRIGKSTYKLNIDYWY